MCNLILNVDSYKASHYEQYPPNVLIMNSYIESRGGRWSHVVFFGLQMFLKEYLSKPITIFDIDEAEKVWSAHGLPFNRSDWEYIVDTHGGYLPLEIEAVAEGSIVPVNNVLVQVRNTDTRLYWLPSYIETMLLRAVWYPTTVCTQSFNIKKRIQDSLFETAIDTNVNFKLHDFGYRGVSSYESGCIGGCAHLVNFMGTDTVGALLYAKKYYNEPMAGYSIPASEHSTIMSWGNEVNEIDAFRNMIKVNKGRPLFACVSDTYNLWDAIKKWKSLESELLKSNNTLVIRPDSGNPVQVTVELCKKLMLEFGHTVNIKGYKVLPNHIRIIQGDGVNEQSIQDILDAFKMHKLSTENIVFGMGGALLQHLDRDTLRFAMKISHLTLMRNDDIYDRSVCKSPITDPNKKSKKGILQLDENYTTVSHVSLDEYFYYAYNQKCNLLKPVWRNGKLLKDYTLNEIRQRIKNV